VVRQSCFEKKTVANPLFSDRDDFENPSADKEPSLTPAAGLSQGLSRGIVLTKKTEYFWDSMEYSWVLMG
jgi:hypothetical protein